VLGAKCGLIPLNPLKKEDFDSFSPFFKGARGDQKVMGLGY